MTFTLLEHEADIGIEAKGATIEEAFKEGGLALFEIMTKVKMVGKKEPVEFAVDATDIKELFVEYLNKLLYLKDIHGMFFGNFVVKIVKSGNIYKLTATAYGEEINEKLHELRSDPKAATYAGLKYEFKDNQHIFRCIVDV